MDTRDIDIDRDDPRFLASQGIDGDLTDAERARLAKAQAASEVLREEAGDLARVDGLVRAWAGAAPELNWEAFHARVMDRIPTAVPAAVPAADAAAGRVVPLSSRRRPARTWRLGPILRIGVPLALAAAIAIMLLPQLLSPTAPVVGITQVCDVTITRPESIPSPAVVEDGAPTVRVTLARHDGAEDGPQESSLRRRLLVAAQAQPRLTADVAPRNEEVFQ